MDNLNQPLDADLPEAGGKQSGLRITPSLRQNWHIASRWGLFFAVLGFLYLGLLAFMLLSVAGLGTVGAGNFGGAEIAVLIFMMLFVGAFVFIPTWFMFQFSQKIQRGVSSNDVQATQTGFTFLRRFYQFVGILLAIVLGMYALIFLLMLFGLMMR
ncbi:MAG: hypothetical protein JNJ90_08460 [Saprospiraceae bacterium]|jgi:hypothetical protein|nr:hypothetical protein [Saprospiraceae bacterium]